MQYSIKKKSKYLTYVPSHSCNQFYLNDSRRSSFDYSRLAISSFFRCSRRVNYAISTHTHLVRDNHRQINSYIAG